MVADEKDLVEGNYRHLTGTHKFLLAITAMILMGMFFCIGWLGAAKIKADADVQIALSLDKWAAKEWAFKFGGRENPR